jgi:hypothetical protein
MKWTIIIYLIAIHILKQEEAVSPFIIKLHFLTKIWNNFKIVVYAWLHQRFLQFIVNFTFFKPVELK